VKKLPTKNPPKNDSLSLVTPYDSYIKELRNKFLRILVFFVIGAVGGGIFYQKILSAFMQIFTLEGINLVLTSPYQFIDLSVKTGMIIGILFAIPIFIYYLLQFIKPALKPQEFGFLLKMLPFSLVLFITGFCFGVWVVQFVIDLFSKTSSNFQVGNIWDLSEFFTEILITGLSLGFVFQLPIFLTGLIHLKITSKQVILKQRKIIYVGLLIFAALMPTTDLVSLLLLTSIPLFLFEVTLLLNSWA